MKRLWNGLVILPLMIALAGCGSTVQQQTRVAADGELGPSGGSEGLPASSETPAADASLDGQLPAHGSTAGATGIGPTGHALADPIATAPGKAAGNWALGLAPGKPIKVGIPSTDVGAIALVFGKDASDPFVTPKRLVAYLNRSGGIGGHPIEPVYFKADSGADAATNGQQACSAFTEDTKVDIVVNAGVLGGDLLASCLQQRGVAMVGGFVPDAEEAATHPNWLLPTSMRLDRQIAAQIQVSAQRGLLKRGDTLGLLVEDCPWGGDIVKTTVQPLLAKLGIALVKGSITCITNIVNDLVPVSNDVQRETLRFNTSHVNRVMALSGAEAFLLANFTKNASQQRYFPDYLLSSNAYPFQDSQPDGVVTYSVDALPHMTGVGTNPLLDVGALARATTKGQIAAQARCKQADPTLGGSESANDNGKYFTLNLFYGLCDEFFLTKALLEADGLRFGVEDVVGAYRRVLATGSSAALVDGRFAGSATGLDGVGMVRPFAYDATRRQFSYVGAAVRVP